MGSTSGLTTEPTTGASATTGGEQGNCPSGWELPASTMASLKVEAPAADVANSFDPAVEYPDGTPAACIRWNGVKTAGVRLAFGPIVGEGPQSMLEVQVTDGERAYEVNTWPPAPEDYAGVTVVYTLRDDMGKVRTWDLAADKGTGFVNATWVPTSKGHHIILDAKLMIPGGEADAQVGFYVDAVVAPASGPTAPFCATLDSAHKCDLVGCAGWINADIIEDLTTCARTAVGQCHAELASSPSEDYDSAYYKLIDGVINLRRVGGEACHSNGSEYPVGWTECGVGPNDPPECACACAAGKCPGDTALALLTGCGLPKPCPDLDVSGGFDLQNAGDCMFQALGADEPVALRTYGNWGDPDWEDRVYLRGDGTASWLHGDCDLICLGSCADRDWGFHRICTLREPAFFSTCADSVDPGVLEGCFDVASWFSGCSVAPASCP